MSKINFKPPGKDTPGYLRRQRKVLEFKAKMRNTAPGSMDAESIDDLVEFLSAFVIEPEDEAAKREALWDASEEQFDMLLNVVKGGNAEAPSGE